MEIVCFFGDSLVNGVNDPERLGWPGRVLRTAAGRGFAPTAYNLGVRRDTSRNILARLDAEIAARVPAGIDAGLFCSFGVADMVEEGGRVRLGVEESAGMAREILERAGRAGRVLMAGPLPVLRAAFRARLAELNRAYGALCAEMGVDYLDVFTPLAGAKAYADSLGAGDGVHPGAAGYAAVAALVENWKPWRDWHGV
ncbi:MAG: hypothetical protein H0S85_16105 [Desulfovibrionaceae bacterium]|jgi:lysophospholipase L1-like esterase|nr:hypothetical protein [Desulfovibrionaceae bacterium]